MPIRVIINGASGKMGRTTVAAIAKEPDLHLCAQAGRDDDLAGLIKTHQADAVIDFTLPECVFDNANVIIHAGARPVIGTTGLTAAQIETLTKLCAEKKRGGIIAPNFSIGAILMMRYAQDAANYFPDVEIIEMHHPYKVDAPSGTAQKTAELIAKSKKQKNTSALIDEKHRDNTSRGKHHHNTPIHSVRLSGLFASQKVIFGDQGELFTLQHDAIDRQAMMSGVFLCCKKVMALDHLVYGLENLISPV